MANISGDYPKVSKGNRISVRFSGNYVKENKSIYPVKSVINIYIVYSLDPVSNARNTDFTAQNCLFGTVKITKDVNTSNYKHCLVMEFVLMKVVILVLVILLMEKSNNFSCDASSYSHANSKKKILFSWVKIYSSPNNHWYRKYNLCRKKLKD